MTAPSSIAVLGLGHMGLPVAVNLIRAGYPTYGWNRSARELPAPGTVLDTVGEVGRHADTVICLLPEVEMLFPHLGPDGLLAPGHRVHTLIVMSTASPIVVRRLAEELRSHRIRVVDAPVSGGVTGAEQARLSIMVGADPADFEEVSPLLHTLGASVRLLGPVGAGSVTKACNQLVVASTLAALAEAAVIAERNGLDRGAVLDVLSGGLAGSEVLTQKRHALVNDDFTPTGPARYLVKDLRFAAESAAAAELPMLRAAAAVYTGLTDAGYGDLDNAVVLEYLRTAQPEKAPGED